MLSTSSTFFFQSAVRDAKGNREKWPGARNPGGEKPGNLIFSGRIIFGCEFLRLLTIYNRIPYPDLYLTLGDVFKKIAPYFKKRGKKKRYFFLAKLG